MNKSLLSRLCVKCQTTRLSDASLPSPVDNPRASFISPHGADVAPTGQENARTLVEKYNERIISNETATTGDGNGPTTNPSTDGLVIAPLATAAALDPSVFSKVNATEAIPATWEERARRAWEYYIEEPLVKNCVNSWRTFAVGDEIRITSDDEDMKNDAASLADRLSISGLVKDMILQLLVKGDAVGFKRYTKDGKDLEEVICVNPVSVKVKYAQGQMVEARQYPDDNPGIGEGLELPVDQVLHLKWDAPSFSPTG